MRSFAVLGLLTAFTAGCAAAIPPQDLVTARAEYERASRGPAAQLDPADLHLAKETLDSAEKSFTEEGDTQDTRDAAYTAERRTEIAESRARAMQSEQAKAAVVAQLNASQAATVRGTSAALGRANMQIAAQDQALQNERQRREDADRRAAAATAALAAFASVKQEARGMVITLSGSVLFVSNKSDLLPGAQLKLNDVADALTKQDPESKIAVEGFTDSQGAAAYNQTLSEQRARVVRDYLVSRGISADRLTSAGFGLTRPIADNASPEGRANNRRVEIIVMPGAAKP